MSDSSQPILSLEDIRLAANAAGKRMPKKFKRIIQAKNLIKLEQNIVLAEDDPVQKVKGKVIVVNKVDLPDKFLPSSWFTRGGLA